MTRDDIIEMARAAKLPIPWISETGVIKWEELERFAALVAAHEREAIAVMADERYYLGPDFAEFAAAIRERTK